MSMVRSIAVVMSVVWLMVITGIGRLVRWQAGNPPPLILPRMKFNNLNEQSLSADIRKPHDFCIKVEDLTIQVHKAVLWAASDYFKMMLECGMKESHEGVIHIQHKADVVKRMIGYFYGKTTCIEWLHIKDYVDIVEIWQLTEVKALLEIYIADNISLNDCIDWFIYADAYHMEHVLQRARKKIIAQFALLSRSKAFESLRFSDLNVLIHTLHNDVTQTALLQCFVHWTLADESSRKHEFSHLLGHLQLTKCNPAYLKHVLYTCGTTVTIDQTIRAEVEKVIVHSLIFVTISTGDAWKLFTVSLARQTCNYYSGTKIGEIPEVAPYHPLCYVTDAGTKVFCIHGLNCALLDLANLAITHLPSLPFKFQMALPLNKARAAAVGRKVFFFARTSKEYIPCLDLTKKEWTMCKGFAVSSAWSTQPWSIHSLCVVSVDSAIFMLCYTYSAGGKFCDKLMCYDTETDTWRQRADPPYNTTYTQWKFAVAINKDIYYVCKKYERKQKCDEETVSVLCYNIMEEKWTTLAQPRLFFCLFATNIKGILALGGYKNSQCQLPYLLFYNSTSNTWESNYVNLPGHIRLVCSV